VDPVDVPHRMNRVLGNVIPSVDSTYDDHVAQFVFAVRLVVVLALHAPSMRFENAENSTVEWLLPRTASGWSCSPATDANAKAIVVRASDFLVAIWNVVDFCKSGKSP
jgi:hypothetical protein